MRGACVKRVFRDVRPAGSRRVHFSNAPSRTSTYPSRGIARDRGSRSNTKINPHRCAHWKNLTVLSLSRAHTHTNTQSTPRTAASGIALLQVEVALPVATIPNTGNFRAAEVRPITISYRLEARIHDTAAIRRAAAIRASQLEYAHASGRGRE